MNCKIALDLTHGDIDRLIGSAIQKEMEVHIPLATESMPEEIQKTTQKQELFSEQDPNSHKQLISISKRQLQSVFHFLKTGTKPWWLPNNASLNQLMETSSLLKLAQIDPETLVWELRSGQTETFLKRMVLQLPESVLIEWFTRAFHFPEELPETLRKTPAIMLSGELKKKWWTILLNAFQEYQQKRSISNDKIEELIILAARQQEVDPERISSFISSITGLQISLKRERIVQIIQDNKEKQASKEIDKSAEPIRKTNQTEVPDWYIPVENAGLILLHPFLKPFFTEIGLMDGDQLTNPELAVHVLHFLATGQENSREYELQFEKFLCEIPEDEPIQQELPISKEIKEEAENLLNAVLEHWTALRSDSPELLRHEFLQREAKIILEEFQSTRLVFERKAQDILLEKLPWNLGIVKVDWQKDLLFVEW